jgi:uncharacterized RDD family membrane protein YckC
VTTSDLHAYIKQAIEAGAAPNEIKKRLLDHGWAEPDVEHILQSFKNKEPPKKEHRPEYLGPNDPIHIEYASPKLRLAAFAIDFLILLPLNAIVGTIILVTGRDGAPIIIPIQLVALWFYFAALESSNTQATIGKKLLGIYVVRTVGSSTSFPQASVRFFSKFASAALIGSGFIYIFLNPKRQGLHDLIADTAVPVRENLPKKMQVDLYLRIGLITFFVLIIFPIFLVLLVVFYNIIKPPVIPDNPSPTVQSSVVTEARDATRKSDIAAYATMLGLYFQSHHIYPTSSGDSSTANNGIFNPNGPLSQVSSSFPSDPLSGQSRCQSNSFSPKENCTYQYLTNPAGSSFVIWSVLELPGSGGGIFFIDSNNSKGLLTSEPTSAP